MNHLAFLSFMVVASLATSQQEIRENCIPYGGYCATSSLPCCWKRESENGCVWYLETTCDFMLKTCNAFNEIREFNETEYFIERNVNNVDLNILYEKWLSSLQ